MFDPSAQYQLEICPLGRRPADEYYHQGQVWIEGREGSTYTLRFTNRSPNRVLVIFSVDGLDVLKGKPAGHLSEGYVVNGNSTVDVPGWKLDNTTAAEFFFSRSSKSYVAKIGGNVNNTGVIGAMVFQEYQINYQMFSNLTFVNNSSAVRGIHSQNTSGGVGTLSVSSSTANNGINAVSANAVGQEVGTGFGAATQWNTVNTVFTRANPTVPNAIMAVYYDSSKNLQKRGIILRTRYGTDYSNSAFPAYTGGATPPAGWKP